VRSFVPFLVATVACTPPAEDDSAPATMPDDTGDSAGDSAAETGDSAGPGDTDETGDTGDTDEPAWGEGPLSISGQAYFFDMETPGQLDWMREVEGAELYVLEAPELRVTLDPSSDHGFTIDGIPEDVKLTLALVHEDYFPHLTRTFDVGDSSVTGVTFQSISRTIATLAAALLGADADDESRCQMATTVTALDPQDVWAPGEPGAIVTIDPEVSAEQGPYYFDENVIPDLSLTETTSDGGVTVVGAEPGTYRWDAHKDGVTFEQLEMKCVGGWLTNASPPYGLNIIGQD
jgi:hypothetical protein